MFRNLLSPGCTGPVYPVSRSARVVQSVKAYSSVLDIRDPVNLAIVAVPRDAVLPVVEECITAGFREVDEEGA